MKVAVTGGTGVVGRAVVRHLADEGHELRLLIRDDPPPQLEMFPTTRGDLLDADSLDRLVHGCEVVFNVAGVNQMCVKDPSHMEEVNVEGVRNMIAACKRAGVRRLVHTSSAVTLGEELGDIGNEKSAHRGRFISQYERTKYEGERVLFAEAGDLQVIAVNPSSVQGPGRATGTGKLILDAVNGRLPFLVESRISLVDIDDCARGHIRAAERGVSGSRYVLSGAVLTISEAVDLAANSLGRTIRSRFVPGWALGAAVGVIAPIARAMGRDVPICKEMVDVMRFGHSYDGTRATRELGLEYTPIAETIGRTLEWFGEEGLLTAAG